MASAAVKKRVRDLIFDPKGEGFIPYMYLDTKNKVTIGYGTMLPDAAAAEKVALLDKDPSDPKAAKEAKAAKADAKNAEWVRVDKLVPEKGMNNKKATSFGKDAALFMEKAEAERLVDLHIDDRAASLAHLYPGFDKFPEDCQVAILDMAYNLGATGLKKKFPSFNKAVNDPKGPNWETAAHESNRPDVGAERNKEVRKLFMNAAEEAKKKEKAQHAEADPHLVKP